MSAFLGPIHVKMYSRILYQDAMAQAIIDLAEKNGWSDHIRTFVDSKAPAASTAPLETIINPNNIHGWLNSAVSVCERRFAAAVCESLKDHPERIKDLEEAMKKMGAAASLPVFADAETAFSAIHDILLDGMPCDFPFETIQSTAHAVAWRVTGCPHTPYWDQDSCGADIYYQLRDAWVEGALAGSPIRHSRPALYEHTLTREDNHA